MFLGIFRKKPKIVKVKSRAKRKTTKRRLKKKTRPKKVKTEKRIKIMPKVVGKVTHYFPHVKAGVVLVTNDKIALGDTLQIKGHTTDFKQKVTSIQINNVPVKEAHPGQEVGILVKSRVRHNDVVYKL